MGALESLKMKKNWLYEIVVSSYSDKTPHVAPFGVRTKDYQNVVIEMYKGSSSLSNVLVTGEFCVNLIDDPVIFYNSLYNRKKIHFSDAQIINAPTLADSPANIEVRLTKADELEKTYLIEAKVVHTNILRESELTNRAKSLFLESLILSTRKAFFSSDQMEKMLNENLRVIKKVAPGSEYEKVMHHILVDSLS